MLFVQGCADEHFSLVSGGFPLAPVPPGTAAVEETSNLRSADDAGAARLVKRDLCVNSQCFMIMEDGLRGCAGYFLSVPGGD
jgi:hypothetical protein